MKKTVYHFWNAKTEVYLGTCNSGGKDGFYVHQAAEIEVPAFPKHLTDTEKFEKKELPDGLYHVIDDVGEPTTWSRMNSEWRRSSGISAGSTPNKVIGRIPVEPIE